LDGVTEALRRPRRGQGKNERLRSWVPDRINLVQVGSPEVDGLTAQLARVSAFKGAVSHEEFVARRCCASTRIYDYGRQVEIAREANSHIHGRAYVVLVHGVVPLVLDKLVKDARLRLLLEESLPSNLNATSCSSILSATVNFLENVKDGPK
jgi:hypothetical protein